VPHVKQYGFEEFSQIWSKVKIHQQHFCDSKSAIAMIEINLANNIAIRHHSIRKFIKDRDRVGICDYKRAASRDIHKDIAN